MSWFEKIMPSRISRSSSKGGVREGLWVKCDACSSVLYKEELSRDLEVCRQCGHHHAISARARLKALLDDGATEVAANVEPVDMLKFKDSKRYKDRISAATKSSGEKDALVVFEGNIHNVPVVAASFDFRFMAGSMGSVVGEKFYRAAMRAMETDSALICFSASGGARMQEALFSLMQMTKTSSALAQLSQRGLPYISVLTHPTTGGVSASLAMLGDIIIAEPKAQIGFAGPRVIEQTVREKLPEGFQRSEFLLEHGAIDQICDRRQMRQRLYKLLSMLMQKHPTKALPEPTESESEESAASE